MLGRRWPLADLNRATIHTLTLGLLVPGPAPNLDELPEGAPFAFERITVAFDFLVDADRYAGATTLNAATNRWPRPPPSLRRP